MKIFHLADLHLGKSVYERDIIEDQRHVLSAVALAARAERPACVIIAGDVFDRAVPPAEAVTLLGEFAAALKAVDQDTVIAIIPGNHDSAARLAFLSPILAGSGVFVASDPASCDTPILVSRDGESARLWLLPFLNPGSFTAPVAPPAVAIERSPAEAATGGEQGELFVDAKAPALRSQSELFAEAMRRIGAAMAAERSSGTPAANILVCHAFASGGQASDSERVFLGNAELVDGSAFDSFDYVALGHLHRPQAVGAKGRYPGSILAYSFSEANSERGFLSVDASAGKATAEFRPVRPLRRMIRLRGAFDEVLADPANEAFTGDYIEAVLDDAHAVLNPVDALRRRFPFLLSIRQAAFEGAAAGPLGGYAKARAASSPADDFTAFYRELRGRDPDSAESALFAELYAEASHEAP